MEINLWEISIIGITTCNAVKNTRFIIYYILQLQYQPLTNLKITHNEDNFN